MLVFKILKFNFWHILWIRFNYCIRPFWR